MYQATKYHCNDELHLDTQRQNSIHLRIVIEDRTIVVVAKILPHISSDMQMKWKIFNNNIILCTYL